MVTAHNEPEFARLEQLIREDEWVMAVLRAARRVDLPDWYVGAGVIRDLIWDHLHGKRVRTPPNDVDVAFFDPGDLSSERDRAATAVLSAVLPSFPWEATNQAAVHTWHETAFGYPIDPLTSSEDGIARWPETATAIGVRLLPNDSMHIYAPCGLEDLFAVKLRRNPYKVTLREFRERVAKKNMAQRWPLVQIIDG